MNKIVKLSLVLAALGGIGYYLYKQVLKLSDVCYKMVGYTIKQINLTKVVLDLKMEIENKSDLSLNIDGYKLNVTVNGNPVGVISSGLNQTLTKNAKSIIVLTVEFNPIQTIPNLVNKNILSGLLKNINSINIGINGTVSAKVGGFVSAKNLKINLSMPLSEMLPNNQQVSTCS